jgi:hypothetical protein
MIIQNIIFINLLNNFMKSYLKERSKSHLPYPYSSSSLSNG